MELKYNDPIQGPTTRCDWSKGEVVIKDLPKQEDFMLALQQRIREAIDELVRPDPIKAG